MQKTIDRTKRPPNLEFRRGHCEYREKKGERIRLHEECAEDADGKFSASEAWWKEYNRARDNYIVVIKYEKKNEEETRTFKKLVNEVYYQSEAFGLLRPSSQRMRMYNMNKFLAEHGDRLVSQMTRQHVKKMLKDKIDKPGARTTMLVVLRILIKQAIDSEWTINSDLTLGMKKHKSKSYHSITTAEKQQFREHWKLGTRERIAFDLTEAFGSRRGDVAKMRWCDIHDDELHIDQIKTLVHQELTMAENLKASLAAWRAVKPPLSETDAIVISARGWALSSNAFGQWLIRAMRKAGLDRCCVPHGLRHAMGTKAAEAGLNMHEIMAIMGHKSPQSSARYTVGARNKVLASNGLEKLRAKM